MATPIDVAPGHNTSFIIISDPSFWRIQDLLSGLDYAYPEAFKLGGFVSAATQTAKRGLFCWSANVQDQSQDGVVQVCWHFVVSCSTLDLAYASFFWLVFRGVLLFELARA